MTYLHPALLSWIDNEGAGIREKFAESPMTALWMLQGSRDLARYVVDDLLARLAEVADQPPEKQLLVAVARLHAWNNETRV